MSRGGEVFPVSLPGGEVEVHIGLPRLLIPGLHAGVVAGTISRGEDEEREEEREGGGGAR